MSVMLVFACPETGQQVPVGIVRGGERLKELGDRRFEFACMVCGQTHSWAINEGRIALGQEEPACAPRPARIP